MPNIYIDGQFISADSGNGSEKSPFVLGVAVSDKTLSYVTGTKAAAGDSELIAAPGAGLRLEIVAIILQNESASATTMILKDGATAKIRCLGQNQGDGLALVFAPGACWKLTANTALNLNLSGSNSCGYTIAYYADAS